MFPGLHPMAMMSTGRFCGAPPPFPPPIYAPLAGQGGAQQGAGDSQVRLYTEMYRILYLRIHRVKELRRNEFQECS